MKGSVFNLLLALSLLLAIFCFSGVDAGQQRINKEPKKVKVNKYKSQEKVEEEPKEKKELSEDIKKRIKAAEEARQEKEKELKAKKKEEIKEQIEKQKKLGVNRKGRKSAKYIDDPADGSIISLSDSEFFSLNLQISMTSLNTMNSSI